MLLLCRAKAKGSKKYGWIKNIILDYAGAGREPAWKI